MTGRSLLAALWLAVTPSIGVTAHFDYLYVEANEGSSSGGHVAIRFGDETYHFQHDDGLIRLRRDAAADFEHAYAMLGNRPIHERRIAVDDATAGLLRDAFSRRHSIQRAQLDLARALARDTALLAALQRHERVLHLPALGFFAADGVAHETASRLRGRVAAERGPAWLAQHLGDARVALDGVTPPADGVPVPAVARDRLPAVAPPLAERVHDAALVVAALEVLHDARGLDARALWTPDDEAFALDAEELRVLADAAATLEANLVRLLGSSRPDRGGAFLVGLARLAALDESIRRGRLVFPDAHPDDPPTLPLVDDEVLAGIEHEAAAAFAVTRTRVLTRPTIDEIDVATLEAAGNRVLETRRARTTRTPLRAQGESALPSRAAPWLGWTPEWSPSTVDAALAAARRDERTYRDRLAAHYGYDLVRRNCVSEIFALIEDAFAEEVGAGGARDEAARRLGGVVDARAGLAFIPFVSARAVDAGWTVVARRDVPSHRAAGMAAMRRREPVWRMALRESNTFTSTLHHPAPDDSAFAFFTDDVPALRPLLGAANLAVGVGTGVAGFFTLPVDGGRRLRAGWRGAFFSLPELVFANIRKGSSLFVARAPAPTS